MNKRIVTILAALLVLSLPLRAMAAGNCTTVAALTASTTILAANDLGSSGRHWLTLQNLGASQPAWCNIGTAAVVAAGIYLPVGGAPTSIPATQQAAKTFPMTPNGAVNCITGSGQSNVSVCDN